MIQPNGKPTYPLMNEDAETLRSASERPVSEITLDAAMEGTLSPDDLQIRAETLHTQAEVAQQGGYPQLAANLTRAAELTAVPNEELLRMYEMLRPRRSTLAELRTLADRLETTYNAPENAAFVREAAAVYETRGLLRSET